ncbi:hypothetical protein EC81_003815 [Bacteroides fragilis]|nr:hypothetical protein EC81_003815 [Bacteroides fragilis]
MQPETQKNSQSNCSTPPFYSFLKIMIFIEINKEYGGIIQIIHLIYKEFIRKSLSLHVPK